MRAGALRAQIRVAGEGLFGWMVPGVFIRVEPVAWAVARKIAVRCHMTS